MYISNPNFIHIRNITNRSILFKDPSHSESLSGKKPLPPLFILSAIHHPRLKHWWKPSTSPSPNRPPLIMRRQRMRCDHCRKLVRQQRIEERIVLLTVVMGLLAATIHRQEDRHHANGANNSLMIIVAATTTASTKAAADLARWGWCCTTPMTIRLSPLLCRRPQSPAVLSVTNNRIKEIATSSRQHHHYRRRSFSSMRGVHRRSSMRTFTDATSKITAERSANTIITTIIMEVLCPRMNFIIRLRKCTGTAIGSFFSEEKIVNCNDAEEP